MKLVYAEDEPALSEAVVDYLTYHKYIVDAVYDGADAYVCNGDGYTGSMIHNYYLYEENGQMAMIPWDYNLAFGTFQGGNAQSTVNTPTASARIPFQRMSA